MATKQRSNADCVERMPQVLRFRGVQAGACLAEVHRVPRRGAFLRPFLVTERQQCCESATTAGVVLRKDAVSVGRLSRRLPGTMRDPSPCRDPADTMTANDKTKLPSRPKANVPICPGCFQQGRSRPKATRASHDTSCVSAAVGVAADREVRPEPSLYVQIRDDRIGFRLDEASHIMGGAGVTGSRRTQRPPLHGRHPAHHEPRPPHPGDPRLSGATGPYNGINRSANATPRRARCRSPLPTPAAWLSPSDSRRPHRRSLARQGLVGTATCHY